MVSIEFEAAWLKANPYASKPDSYYVAQLQRRPMNSRELWAMFVNWGGAIKKRRLDAIMAPEVQ